MCLLFGGSTVDSLVHYIAADLIGSAYRFSMPAPCFVTLTLHITLSPYIILQKEENQRRAQHGEPLLPVTDEAVEQELNLKPVVAPGRLDTLLIGEQVDHRCQQISEIAGAAFGKLYLAEGLQPK